MHHPTKQGWFIVEDTKWLLSVEFEEHRFNETQDILDFGHIPIIPAKIAKEVAAMGDWLRLHHYAEVFEIPVYELRLSENDSEVHVIRHKHPAMDAVFKAGSGRKEMADALSKAAEFLRKAARLPED